MPYIISGKVIKGDGYGRKIGFHTVNLEVEESEFPPEGIYTGKAEMEGKTYRAGIVIGPHAKIEAHLIGYRDNAYGKKVVLHINKFLREYRKFNTEEELITQIKKDLDSC